MPIRRYATPLFILTLLLWCMASLVRAAPQPVAKVDRNVVTQGDSLTLTVHLDDTGSYDSPDFSPLRKDFDVFGTSENSQHVISNGSSQSWTEWQTTLIPKHSGAVTIPAIAVAGGQTQPITIHVNPPGRDADANSNEPYFVEAKVDRDSVYVQQQLLLTVRAFHAVPLDDMKLTEPDFDNATVRKASETSYRREINGVTYLVHERSYAIFPQQAGDLTIPELVFSATEPTRPRSLFDFPGQGRAIRRLTRQITVHVKPIPKQFTGSVWLPGRNLTISASWGGDPQHVAVGDSITRAVTIRADGLQASQLPALDQPNLTNAKLYADQPTLDDQQDADGIHGKRVESAALIPGKAGTLTLPAQRVVWWDVDSDSQKVTTLPAETIRVRPGTGGNNNGSTAPVIAEPQAAPAPAAAAPNVITVARAAWWWPLTTALLALAWLVTLLLYLRLRRRLPPPAVAAAQPRDTVSEDRAFAALGDACRANDPAAARHALLAWARCFYRDEHLRSSDDLLRRSDSEALQRELQLLDNKLFGSRPDSGGWNGENLLAAVRRQRRSRPGRTDAGREQLPPLYPAG